MPKLSADPGFPDLQYALSQAQKNAGRQVELPWTSAGGQGAFMLTVKSDPSLGDPVWTMHTGAGEQPQVNWTYQSGDMQLILNLALAESSGGQLQDVHQAGAYAAAPKPKGDGQASPPASTAAPPSASLAASQVSPAQVDTGTHSRAILEGDLKNMQVPNLLQSVVMSKMTGRLGIQGDQGSADIYFEEGVPVHAQVASNKGDMALIELLTWDEGLFQFSSDERTTHRSVNKRLDAILMEGIALVDQHKFLTAHGLKLQSYLLRKQKSVTEAQFEEAIAKGAPLDLTLQKRFYQAVDNRSTLFDLLRKMPMQKTDWVPLMFNMITCELLTVTDKAPLVTQEFKLPLESINVDHAAIQSVVKSLQRPETGLFTYPAFLYLVEQEYLRFESCGIPFTIIVFEMRFRPTGPQGPLEPLPPAAVKEIAQRIATVKRTMDLLAHYETFDYACMLPNTNSASGAMFAGRVLEVIRSAPVPETPDVRSISLSLGVASVPEDCKDLGMLLAAAREAKNRAKEKNSQVVLYKEMTGR